MNSDRGQTALSRAPVARIKISYLRTQACPSIERENPYWLKKR